jgi:outer membrane immunogenic protein
VAAPVYDWTGFYFGGHIGGGWANNRVSNVDGTVEFPAGFVHNNTRPDGFLAGGYIGLNYQAGPWVFGIEGDYTWLDLKGTAASTGPTGAVVTTTDQLEWLAAGAFRVGYALNNWMVFAKGGWAWAEFTSNGVVTNGGAVTSTVVSSDYRNGWMVGGGVEWAFALNWVARLEYNYIDFGDWTYSVNSTTVGGVLTTFNRTATSSLNIGKAGVAFKF